MKREYSVQTEQSLKVAHSPESCREVIFSYLFKTKKKKKGGVFVEQWCYEVVPFNT